MRLRFTFAYAALFLPFAVATPYLQVLLRCRGFECDHIGLILGSLEVMSVMAPPLWGYAADRTGRPKLLLCLAIAGCVPTFLIFGTVHTLVPALCAAVVFGAFFRPCIPLTDGLTFRYLASHGGDYGSVRAGGSVAFICCIAALEWLGIARSRTGVMILVAMCVVTTFQLFSVTALPRDGHAPDVSARTGQRSAIDVRVFLQRGFLLFVACAFLGRLAMMGYYGFFSLFLKEELGFAKAGYIWILGPLSEIPVIYFSRRIMDRIGVRNLFALGLLGCAVRLFGFSVARNVWHVVPLQFLHALTFGAFHCASVTYVSRYVPKHMTSTAQTLFAGVVLGGGGIVGGALGGRLAQQYGYSTLYAVFSGVALVALILLLVAVPGLEERGSAGGGCGKF